MSETNESKEDLEDELEEIMSRVVNYIYETEEDENRARAIRRELETRRNPWR